MGNSVARGGGDLESRATADEAGASYFEMYNMYTHTSVLDEFDAGWLNISEIEFMGSTVYIRTRARSRPACACQGMCIAGLLVTGKNACI